MKPLVALYNSSSKYQNTISQLVRTDSIKSPFHVVENGRIFLYPKYVLEAEPFSISVKTNATGATFSDPRVGNLKSVSTSDGYKINSLLPGKYNISMADSSGQSQSSWSVILLNGSQLNQLISAAGGSQSTSTSNSQSNLDPSAIQGTWKDPSNNGTFIIRSDGSFSLYSSTKDGKQANNSGFYHVDKTVGDRFYVTWYRSNHQPSGWNPTITIDGNKMFINGSPKAITWYKSNSSSSQATTTSTGWQKGVPSAAIGTWKHGKDYVSFGDDQVHYVNNGAGDGGGKNAQYIFSNGVYEVKQVGAMSGDKETLSFTVNGNTLKFKGNNYSFSKISNKPFDYK